MSTVVAKVTARVAGAPTMIHKGRSYDTSDRVWSDVIDNFPELFHSPEDAAKADRRPTSTDELGERSMSARKKNVEQATDAPGELRDAGHPCSECDFVAKSAAGLGAHGRTHD